MKPYALVEDGNHLQNGYHLAKICELAYSDDPAGNDRELAGAFDRVEPFDTGETEGFVASNKKHVVVAFRGTDQPLDWLRNLDAGQIPGYGGRVHEGFDEALDEAWFTVLRKVQRLRDHDQTLWVTGHSLGGAVATLAAKRLQGEKLAPHATFTFGAPRVFDPAAVRKYRLLLYRFVNNADIAPHVPPPVVFLRLYKHVGTLVHLMPDGSVDESETAWDDLVDEAAALASTATEANLAGPLSDHAIKNYIKRIKKAIGE